MAGSSKKVLVRLATGEIHPGYLPPAAFVSAAGSVDLLDLHGRIVPVPFAQIRSVAYVRDFNLADTQDPERLTRRAFLARPRNEGLWLRLTLVPSPSQDPAPLEGLAPLDLSLFDSLVQDRGLFLTPPDVRSNTQRLFIPHHTIASLQILAVITTPSRTKAVAEAAQPTLFS